MNRTDIPGWLFGFVGMVVILLFLGSVLGAGYYTLWVTGAPAPDRMPAVAIHFASNVNALLLANLGAYFGTSVITRTWRVTGPIAWLQAVAAVAYVLILVVAALLWWRAGFIEDPAQVVSTLPEIVRGGLGVVIAIFAAGLGVHAGMNRLSQDDRSDAAAQSGIST